MAIKYGEKVRELMVKEIGDVFAGKTGFIFSGFDHIKAGKMDAFRKEIKKSGTRHFVIKKQLGRIALEKAGVTGLTEVFKEEKNIGMTVIEGDPIGIAKILTEFEKANSEFSLLMGYLEGQVMDAARIKALAKLPDRKQLLAMVAGTMNAPIAGFVGTLAAILRSLCYALNSVKDKKEAA